MVYLELFNGRRTLYEDMAERGTDGPILGPFPFLHTTYGDNLKFGEAEMLSLVQGLIFYADTWYGDWSVISPDTVMQNDDLKVRVQPFDADKAKFDFKDLLAAA